MTSPMEKILEDIFLAGVQRVDPDRLLRSSLVLDESTLKVMTPAFTKAIEMNDFDQVFILGAGKATAKMARSVEDILGDRITDGVISVKYGHTEALRKVRCIEAAHPVPDEAGIRASRAIAALAKAANQKTLVINLISGGGSALIPFPAEYASLSEPLAISLAEKQDVTRALLECGATINEINCIRKHLSQIKGGRLAEMLHPATSLSLILSDVVGDVLDTIASGPTTFDQTTFSDAQAIIDKYDLASQIPARVKRYIELGIKGDIADTPGPSNTVFEKVDNVLIGTNYLSLQAARKKAESYGYHTVILSSQIIGEAREVARVLCGIAKDARKQDLLGPKPLCIVCGGETTVTIRGQGKGGRNQEMALAFLAEIEKSPQDTDGIYFLAASTDGNDGPTDAAGAFASNSVLGAAQSAGLSIIKALKNNDAYHFYDKIGKLLKTGPTNTNVCDIQIALIEPLDKG